MKNLKSNSIILMLTAIAFSISSYGQKTEVTPTSKLQKVVVYSDKALITKEASGQIKKGENIIRISGITSNLENESVQVNLLGQTDVNISEVAIDESYLNKTEQPELQRLLKSLENVNIQIREGNDQISVLNSSNDFLKKVVPFPTGLKVSSTEIEAHTRFLEKSLTLNFEKMGAIDKKLKTLNAEKVAIEKEIANLGPDKNKSKSIIIHLLSAADKSGMKFSYNYLTSSAGWIPQYEAKADNSLSKIELNYYASIWQSTGEDWMGANLEISTAKPFVYGNTPELTGWYLDIYKPRQVVYKSAPRMVEMRMEEKSNIALNQMESASEDIFKKTEVIEDNTSFSFALPRKVDIISDGQPHRVLISNGAAEATFSYFTIPKLVKNAFLKTTMKNPFAFPLLTGSMGVFFDQKMVGTTSLNETILPGGEMRLSFGIDEGIRIEHKLFKKNTDYAGVFSKETKVHFEYQIDITNGKNKEITLDLNDQFPVSRNEKIKVEIEEPKGGDAVVNEEGIISWKLTLAAGAKKSLTVRFNISYPKDLTVSGL